MYETLLTAETEESIEELAGELKEIGSWNHSIIQANVTFSLKRTGEYQVLTELSLDVSQLDPKRFKFKDEIKPDVCVYPKHISSTLPNPSTSTLIGALSRPYDILKMTEMPITVIEILSPSQSNYEFLNKFEAYFTLGVKSCWLVDPVMAVVAVYRSLTEHKVFTADEVVDEVSGIRLPFAEIFE